MKSLYEYCVNENISAQTIFEICSWLENTPETIRQMEAIVKAMARKNPETISFEKLASASTVDKLAAAGAKLAKLNLDTATRKECKRYIAACIMRMYNDETGNAVADWNSGDWNYADLDW
jgi:hypothetical protein